MSVQEVAGVMMTCLGVIKHRPVTGRMEKPTPRLLTTHVAVFILMNFMQA
jgi:hypothetical protein